MEEALRGHVGALGDAARRTLTVRRVFGEPIIRGDVTVIPVARLVGGSGLGFGSGSLGAQGGKSPAGGQGEGDAGGGGFGVSVRALGVYVVQGDRVTWRPALDLNRAILGGQVVGAIAVLALARVLRRSLFRWR